jgi:putative ABC transport system ATP-binding protein
MLQMNQVSKVYRKEGELIHALRALDLTVNPGEFVALQGPSGSGKTTLLLIAGGLLHPDSGQVCLEGENIYEMDGACRARWRAQNIGFVFQQYHLLSYLTVYDNLLVPQISQPKPRRHERALQLLRQFGLEKRRNHLPAELSAGEKQRTALARALLLQPRIVLADEITGNLDQENALIVVRYLEEYARDGGSVLLATHDPAMAGRADRVVRLATTSSSKEII